MCYVHLADECPTCDSYKQRFGREPDRIEWTNYFRYGGNGGTPHKQEIRILGIKIGEIKEMK